MSEEDSWAGLSPGAPAAGGRRAAAAALGRCGWDGWQGAGVGEAAGLTPLQLGCCLIVLPRFNNAERSAAMCRRIDLQPGGQLPRQTIHLPPGALRHRLRPEGIVRSVRTALRHSSRWQEGALEAVGCCSPKNAVGSVHPPTWRRLPSTTPAAPSIPPATQSCGPCTLLPSAGHQPPLRLCQVHQPQRSTSGTGGAARHAAAWWVLSALCIAGEIHVGACYCPLRLTSTLSSTHPAVAPLLSTV